MKRILRARAIGACLFLALAPDVCAEFAVGAGTEYFNWREYEVVDWTTGRGDQLLEEGGVRAVASIEFGFPITDNASIIARGRTYSGDVDYDGQTQLGAPVATTTGYSGTAVEAGFTYGSSARAGATGIKAVIAGGVETWKRDIHGSGGYREEYTMPFLRLGMEDMGHRWQGRAGLLVPVDTAREHVSLADGIDLEPKAKPHFYFGLGYRFRLGMELFAEYHGIRFGESNDVPVRVNGQDTGYVIWQPRSELDTLGIQLRARF